MMKPHLVRWHKSFGEKGLTILDIDNGGIDQKERLEKSARKLPFATLWDEGGKLCKTYGIRGYPSAYLIGVDGKVLWEGVPMSAIEEIEGLIKEELKKVDPKILDREREY
jgi:peroxiredoxin